VQSLEKIPKLEDAISTALAADEYLLEALRGLCCLEIERMVTVENVWHTLNSTCLVPKVASACCNVTNRNLNLNNPASFTLNFKFQLLASETTKCLEHPSFFEACQDSLIFLLQMDTLNVESELDLLNASLKLANSRSVTQNLKIARFLCLLFFQGRKRRIQTDESRSASSAAANSANGPTFVTLQFPFPTRNPVPVRPTGLQIEVCVQTWSSESLHVRQASTQSSASSKACQSCANPSKVDCY